MKGLSSQKWGAAKLAPRVSVSVKRRSREKSALLPIEVGHRLLDALGGRLRLLAHRIPQRGLDAAVADPGFQRAVDREHEHDKPDQRDDVFGEQALPQEPDFVLDLVHPDPRAPLLVKNRVCASAVAPRQYSLLGRATLRACFSTK
jgi:hypothetical protein